MKNKYVRIIISCLVIITCIILFHFVINPLFFSRNNGNPCRTFGSDYKVFNEKRVDEKTGEKHTYSMCCNEDKTICVGLEEE